MFNFEHMISVAAKSAGDKPILAAHYPLADVLCRDLASKGLITGYITDKRPNCNSHDPFIAGWWLDRSAGTWFIRNFTSSSIIFLTGSRANEIGGGLLLEARLKGIRRIFVVASDGSIANEIEVATALLEQLASAPVANPIHRLSYDEMFDDVYRLIGDQLRLPSMAFETNRVLFITGSLEAGGAERQTVYSASGVARRCPGQVFLGRCRVGPDVDFYKPMLDAAGVTTCAMPEWADEYSAPKLLDIRNRLASRHEPLGIGSIFYMIFHHALMIRKIKPGLVHTWQDYSNILAGIAADLVGVPRLVLSGRSLAPDNFLIFQPYMAPAYRALLKRREFVFLNNSEAGARDYARWLQIPRERIRVIHNGFEFPTESLNSRASLRRNLGIREDAIVVGSIIGFREEKRPELFIDMARTLHELRPDVRFLVFGEGPLLNTCRTFVNSKGLSEVIKLPGLAKNAWEALSAMDIFVLTSRLEGLPNVLIEAQGMGFPVVCTGAGGMCETFVEGKTGYAVSSATPEALAETIGRLVDDPELLRCMGEKAFRHARETFGIDRMVDLTIDAYRTAKEHEARTPDWKDLTSLTDIRLGAILKEMDRCFVAELPSGVGCSAMNLWEDDLLIGPAGSEVSEIRRAGSGRYRIVEGRILFSTSDDTDARFNGRTYSLRSNRDHDEIVVNVETMQPELGYCFTAGLGLSEGSARFALWENETRLGPGTSIHDEIRTQGKGRYSVWGETLYFSSSDNSDPRTNQRAYVLHRGRPAAVPTKKDRPPTVTSLDHAMRHLVSATAPRDNFVPGRIVHVSGSLGPGGAERQIFYTLAQLIKEPLESVQLLSYYLEQTDHQDFYLPMLKAAGVPVRLVRRQVGQADPGNMPTSLREVKDVLPQRLALDIADLFWEFIELRPEVVHAWLDGNNERAGLAAALAGVPRIVMSGRNMNPKHFAYYESYMDPAYGALLELPHVTMLNNSRAGRDDYADWLGIDRDRIRVVYNAVDFGDRTRSPLADAMQFRRELGVDENAFLVGGVFRFAPEKRPLLWIETAAEVARLNPGARFVVFGYGGMRSEMEQAVERLDLRDRLLFLGVTADILTAMSAIDVLLLTSCVEGVPNVVLEAQWVGTPVVATAAGGVSESVHEGVTGWVVEPPTPSKLAQRILWLHDNQKERRAVEAYGPAFVRKRFAMARMIEETLEVYGMRNTRSMPELDCGLRASAGRAIS